MLYPLVLPIVELGTQFTCFTGTKVRILTQRALLGYRGAQDDHEENTAEAFEAAEDVAELKADVHAQLLSLQLSTSSTLLRNVSNVW